MRLAIRPSGSVGLHRRSSDRLDRLYKYIQQAHFRGVRSLSSLVASVTGAPEAKLAAVLSVVFLSVYAAAQLTSGGKALLP